MWPGNFSELWPAGWPQRYSLEVWRFMTTHTMKRDQDLLVEPTYSLASPMNIQSGASESQERMQLLSCACSDNDVDARMLQL